MGLSPRPGGPRHWHDFTTQQLTRLHAHMVARERLEAQYFDGRDILFPAVRRKWDEELFECRKQALLTYRLLELDHLTEDEIDEAIPDEDTIGRWVTEILEPARMLALDKLGESDLSLRLATDWLRPKLAADRDR
jgi:hypothetical protein